MPAPLPHSLSEALGSIVRGQLPGALHELLNALRLALAEQRLRSFSSQEAKVCGNYLRFCNAEGERVLDNSWAAICRHLPLAAARQPRMPDNLAEWSLLDDAEVEDMLLARRLLRPLRESLGALELQVCGCFNRLAGHAVPDADHPLSLEFLIRQLLSDLRLRAQPTAIRTLFQVEASRVLPMALQAYLKALAGVFEAHRVEPLPEPKAPVRGRQQPRSLPALSPDAAYRAIRRLLQVGAEGQQTESVQRIELGDTSTSDALAKLHTQQVPAGGWDARQLLERLVLQGCRLTARQCEDTHMVSEVFQALGQQAGMAPALKPAMQRLLLPVLEATLKEPAAIADGAHPVRATLDRLLRLCDFSDPPNEALEARLELLIGRIVGGNRGDLATFTACDAELDELLKIQQRAYRRSAERVMQLHRGRDILEHAQREVATALTGLYGEQVPQLLLEWLGVGWRDLLVNDLIRAGADKYSWRGDLAVTALVIRRLQKKPTRPADTYPVTPDGIDNLLQILRRRMDEFGAGNFQYAPVLNRLRRQLLGDEPVTFVAPSPLPSIAPPLPAELQRWYERLEALQVGDWLQARDGQALQLIWGNPQMDHYVFVDAQGREAGSYGSAKLTGLLAEGTLLIGNTAAGDDNRIQRTLQDIVGQLYREIAHTRSHDELTGLFNRRSFEGAVAQSLSTSARPAFLMAHIDQFNLINGHAGPLAGDACLRQLASQLHQWLPESAYLARVGGVEFAAVLPDCGEELAARLAEELRRAVEEEGFAWDGSRHGLTLSIGVVEAADQHDVSNLFCDLQAACNIAKETGRNRVHCFDRAADDDRIGLQAIAVRIDDIVERENLSLRVQQIAPAAPDSSELPHYELLLVMQNELLLQDFIAAAERYHRMTKVDRWVLTRIFSELERHPQLWTRCSSMSINLSGSSLNDDRLLGFIESLFERYAVDPRNICFELTETAAVANLAKTADLVRHLQRAGCTFAIDDFGVGFSSFDYLKRLPVDYVKIDGSFVKEIERSPSDLAMVRSINEVAHALGRRTIAEYVETPSIRALLAEMGVDYVQGFGVQKPRGLGDWLSDEALLLCPS